MSREEEITKILKQHGERLRHLETAERSAAGTSAHKDTHDPQTGTDPLDCGVPATILAQDTAPAESATDELARSGHVHGIQVGVPSDVGVANAEGGSTEFVRKDHVHGHGSGYLPDAHHPEYASIGFRICDTALVLTNPGVAYAEVWPLGKLRQNPPFAYILPRQARIHVSFYINEATTYGFEVYNFTDGAQVCEVTGNVAAGQYNVQGPWTACVLAATKNLGIRVKGGTVTVDLELYVAIMEIR